MLFNTNQMCKFINGYVKGQSVPTEKIKVIKVYDIGLGNIKFAYGVGVQSSHITFAGLYVSAGTDMTLFENISSFRVDWAASTFSYTSAVSGQVFNTRISFSAQPGTDTSNTIMFQQDESYAVTAYRTADYNNEIQFQPVAFIRSISFTDWEWSEDSAAALLATEMQTRVGSPYLWGRNNNAPISVADESHVYVRNVAGYWIAEISSSTTYYPVEFTEVPTFEDLILSNVPTTQSSISKAVQIRNGVVNYILPINDQDSINVRYRISTKWGNGASTAWTSAIISNISIEYNIHKDISAFATSFLFGVSSSIKIRGYMFGGGDFRASTVITLGAGDTIVQKIHEVGGNAIWDKAQTNISDTVDTSVAVIINGRPVGKFSASPNGSFVSFQLPTEIYQQRNNAYDKEPYDSFE